MSRPFPAAALIAIVLVACSVTQTAPPASQSIPSIAPTSSASATVEESADVTPEDWTAVMTLGDGSTRMVGGPIAHGTAGFLMVGALWGGGEGGPRRLDQSMWRSANGMDWEEIDDPEELSGVSIDQVTASADGTYVIYGSRSTQDVGYEVIALRSSDGRTWEEVETGLPQVIYVQAIERGPSGYLLVGGQGGETNPTLWLSADGLAWELVHEFKQTEHWVQIHDADGGEDGYVVLGRRIEEDGDYRRFAFASADGREWVNRDQPFGRDNQAYVFEANVSSLGPDWVATLGHPDAPTATWLSANGLDWSEVGSLDAAGHTSAGVFEEVGDELLFSPMSGCCDDAVGVWSSTDGATWAPVEFGADIWLGGIAQGDSIIAATGTVPSPDFTSTAGAWVRASD